MSIKKKIEDINKTYYRPCLLNNEVSEEDLDVALFIVLQRQTHEHETLRLTKEKLLEIVRVVNQYKR